MTTTLFDKGRVIQITTPPADMWGVVNDSDVPRDHPEGFGRSLQHARVVVLALVEAVEEIDDAYPEEHRWVECRDESGDAVDTVSYTASFGPCDKVEKPGDAFCAGHFAAVDREAWQREQAAVAARIKNARESLEGKQ